MGTNVYLSLAALILQMVFLAIVMCLVGWGINRAISNYMQSRIAARLEAEAMAAAARFRATSRTRV